jgi:hypothetical protein
MPPFAADIVSPFKSFGDAEARQTADSGVTIDTITATSTPQGSSNSYLQLLEMEVEVDGLSSALLPINHHH